MEIEFEIRLFWDEVDKVYFAEAVKLKGCIHHGRTYQKALERLLKLIPIWLANNT